MVIYLDLIFGINVLFNFFILLLANYLTKSGQRFLRIFLGSLIASCIIPIQLLSAYPFFHSLLFKGLYSLMIILFTFGYNGFYIFMKRLGMFYFITFTIGGGLLSIQFLFREMANQSLLIYMNNIYGDQISLVLLFIGFPFFLFFMKKRMDRHVKDKMKYDQMYKVVLKLNGIQEETVGYIDSGNQLTDPLTNRPVVVCDHNFLRRFFPVNEWEDIVHALELNQMEWLPDSVQKRVYLVPYQGVGESSGLLYTFRPDKLMVHYGGEFLETNKVLIGIQQADLSIDGTYHCLLHPELIQLKMTKTA